MQGNKKRSSAVPVVRIPAQLPISAEAGIDDQ
jgi:hypothetical protein